MFASVRKYHNVVSVDEVKQRAEREFLPLLKQNPGFRGYYSTGTRTGAWPNGRT